jgi:hypothetical protein
MQLKNGTDTALFYFLYLINSLFGVEIIQVLQFTIGVTIFSNPGPLAGVFLSYIII